MLHMLWKGLTTNLAPVLVWRQQYIAGEQAENERAVLALHDTKVRQFVCLQNIAIAIEVSNLPQARQLKRLQAAMGKEDAT